MLFNKIRNLTRRAWPALAFASLLLVAGIAYHDDLGVQVGEMFMLPFLGTTLLQKLQSKRDDLHEQLVGQYEDLFGEKFGDSHDEETIKAMAEKAADAAIDHALEAADDDPQDKAAADDTIDLTAAIGVGVEAVKHDTDFFPARNRKGRFGDAPNINRHSTRSPQLSKDEPSVTRIVKASMYKDDRFLEEVDTKALSTGTDSEGGYLLDETQMPEIVELRDKMDAVAMWVQEQGGVILNLDDGVSTLNWPKEAGRHTLEMGSENTEPTPSYASYGQMVLQPHMVTGLTKIPIQLIKRSVPAAEAHIRRLLARDLGEKSADQVLNGDGTGQNVDGLFNLSGTGSFTMENDGGNGAVPTYDDIVDLLSDVEQQGAVANGLLGSPRSKAIIRKIKDQQGLPIFIRAGAEDPGDGDILGVPWYQTRHISDSMTKGTASNASKLIAGDAESVVIARFGGIELAADTAGEAFRAYQVHLRINQFIDFNIGRPGEVRIADGIIPS